MAKKKEVIMWKVLYFSIFLVILMNCLTPCIAVNNSTENNASSICVDENNETTVTIPLSLPSPTPSQFKVDQFISANATNHVHHITSLTQSSKSKWNENGHYYEIIKKADLILLSSDISFSNPNPALGETVTIAASIHNIGDADANNVVVQFFDNEMQIGSDQIIGSITAGGTGTAQVAWTATVGTHDISVIIDPYNEIAEVDETNNIAHTSISIGDFSTWQYNRTIYINENSSNDLTDYQVLINLSGNNFPLEANDRGADIRFVDEYGNVLNYWIEEYDYSAKRAMIWVKVPEIPANGIVTLQMYWYNPGATPRSNGDATFLFFDDFLGTSLDTNKWKSTMNSQLLNSAIKTWSNGTGWKHLTSKYTILASETAIVEVRAKSESADRWHILFLRDKWEYELHNRFCILDGIIIPSYQGNHIGIQTKIPSSDWKYPHDLGVMQNGRWYKLKIIKSAEKTMTAEFLNDDGTLIDRYQTTISDWNASKWSITQAKYNDTYDYWDYIFVRNYADSEPTISISSDVSAWQYSRTIYIKENSGNDLTDYQVLINLSENNFPAEANERGADIQFVDKYGNVLNYWIEEYDYSAKRAMIWVKVPYIKATGTVTLQMYFGNPKAQPTSNFTQVQSTIFNGDFELGNLSGWQSSGIKGGFACVVKEGTSWSSGSDTTDIILDGEYAANVRSSGPAPTDSWGILTSEPYILKGETLRWRQLSETSSIFAELGIFDALTDAVLETHIIPVTTQWMYQERDLSAYKGQPIKIQFKQHTTQAGKGWFTLCDNVNIEVFKYVYPEPTISFSPFAVPGRLDVNIIEPINYSVYTVGDSVQFNITVSDLNDSLLFSDIFVHTILSGPDNASKIIPFSIDGNFFVGEYSISSDDSKGVWVANVTAYNSTHSGLSTSIIIFTSPYTIHVKSDKASHVLGEVVAFDAEAYRLGVSGGVLTGSDVCLNLSIYDKDFTLVYGPESMSYDNFSQSFISQVDTDLLGKGWFNVSVAGDDASGNLANTTTDFFVADDFEVNVSTGKSIYDRGESVNISGAAVFGDGSAVDNATVSIAINVKGFTRTFVTDTNDDGGFNYTFNPFTYEAGNYNLTVTVDYWGLKRVEEADFSITGLYLRPESETLDMAENSEYVFNLTLFNLGESTLTGITASLVDRNATDNVFGVLDTSTLPDMLLPGENRSFALVVVASEDALGESEFSVVVSSVQTSDGVSEILVRIHPNKPVLDVIPGKVEAGLNLNHSTVKSFTISNSGYGTLRNVTMNQPSNPWLQIISDERVGDIPPGVNVSINFVISSFHVGLGEYSEAVSISSDNYETVSVEVTVHVTDSSTGSLLFYVGDVLERNVSNASVYLINYDTYDEFISLTNTTGYVLLENLPIGRYTYEVSSKDTGHFPQTGTVIVEPMENSKLVEVMLYLSFVDFEWEVIPTAIKDKYIIRLNLTFETDIQIPILVAYPPFLNYNLAPGETVQDSITLYNIGLISLYDVTISPPNFGDGVEIDFPLGQKVPEIKAKERVEVPFTIRLSDTASECKKYKGKISATGTFIHFINSKQVEGTAGTSIPLTIRTPCAQHDVPLPDIPSPCFFIGLPFLGEFHTGPCIDVDGISSYNNYRSDSAVIWILSVTDCEGETLEIFTKKLIATNCNHKGINLFPKAWGVSKDCSISPISFSFLDASLIEGVDEFWYGTWTCPSTSDGLWRNIRPNEVAKLDVHHIGISKGVGFSPINFVGGMLFFFYGYDTPICPGLVPIIGMSFNEMCIPQVGPIKPIDYRIDMPFWGPYPDWRGDIPFPWRDFSIDISINPPGLPGVPAPPPPPPKMPKPPLISDTIHEIVKLYISQEATMERDAFYAGLSMYNKMGDKDISSMKINLKITDSNNSVNDLFFIRSPRLVGIGDVSGSGTLGPLSRANIQWLIIPKPGAGGTDPEGTVYNISADISYSVDGQNFKFRTQQAQITVKPQPQIVLDYYMPSDVVANIPFKLAVKATNEGYSTARNFGIETAQPVIYDNVAGLMIDFKIIGSSLSGQPRSNSLKVNFGNIEPRESKLTWWEMVTTLDGTFTEFTGTYTHSSELGGAETSLIKELNTHIILREIDTGEITYDFLVDSDMDGIPDYVINSVYGTSTAVLSRDYNVTMEPTSGNPTLTISTKKVEDKWICTSVEDPYENKVPIKKVERSDGKILSPQNYWMRDSRILIVDDPVQEYTITYETPTPTPPNITNVKPGNLTAISGDTIELNCSVMDDIGVASVWLNYTTNNWTAYDIKIMDNPYSDFYTTNLTLPDVNVIEYKIEASDEVGNIGDSGIFKMMILPIGYIYVPNDCPTIQTAIDAANPSDTIIVRDGTYTENIEVAKPHLTIKSENGSVNCIVQAANPDDNVFEVMADHVDIRGFTVKGATEMFIPGIYLNNTDYCDISNNVIANNHFGIALKDANNNALTSNIVKMNDEFGISLINCNNNALTDNKVDSNNWIGLVLYYGDNNTLSGNTMSGNRYNFGSFSINDNIDKSNLVDGKPIYYIKSASNIVYDSNTDIGTLYCINCKNVTVRDLNLRANTHGVSFFNTSNSKIENVKSSNNWQGILLDFSSSNNILINNDVSYNEDGISIYSSNNNIIEKNSISNNRYGLRLISSSNNFYLNNFINNVNNHFSKSPNLWNSHSKISYAYNRGTYENYLGNYWDDYSGNDANGNGIGDIPYIIDSDRDNYPLMQPWEQYIQGPIYIIGGEEFTKRKQITVDNTRNANTLTDYQVKLDVIYEPEMQPDFDDLRFTDSNDNPLNYWVEDYTPGARATIWVKIPLIPGSGTKTVYIYYGNAGVGNESNGDTVFEFFDDFEDGDDVGWGHEIGSWIVNNGEYTATGKSGVAVSSVGSISWTDYIFEGDLRITQKGAAHLELKVPEVGAGSKNVPDNGIHLVIFPAGNSIYWHVIENGIGYPQGMKTLDVSVNRPIHVKVEIAGDTYKAYVNEILKNTLIDNTYSSGKIAVCVNLNYPTPTTWDNILVRKYADPEPTITIKGTDLAAEWHFDEGSGSTVKDNTGNGNDGIIHGAMWINGIKGKALKFDGKDDYVEVQDSSSLRITGNLNVEAWVKVEELGSKYHFIVSKHYTPAGYTLYINPANKFAFEINGQHSVASTTTPELGQWYHVVGTYDHSQLKIYVNDVLENTKGCTAKLATNNQKLRIGQWSAGGYCFKGIIDEVRIYANA